MGRSIPYPSARALRFAVLIDVTKREVVYWDGRWVRGWAFRDPTLRLVREDVIGPLSDTAGDNKRRLERRRASGTQEEKLAAAIAAGRIARRQSEREFAVAMLTIGTVVFYLLGGLGAAIFGLVFFGSAIALEAWLRPKWSDR